MKKNQLYRKCFKLRKLSEKGQYILKRIVSFKTGGFVSYLYSLIFVTVCELTASLKLSNLSRRTLKTYIYIYTCQKVSINYQTLKSLFEDLSYGTNC